MTMSSTQNQYYLNAGGRTQALGQANNYGLAAADAHLIAQYATLPIMDPAGGRRLSTGGQVWLERTGGPGWTPLIYTGPRPPASDAPSSFQGLINTIGIGGLIVMAGLIYYVWTTSEH
jgi:hypothetical protein